MGAGVGAVYTVTGAPPPCGVREMPRILTPMVAQSSEEASLTTRGTLPDGTAGGGEVVTELAPEPPPQAVSVTARPVVSAVQTARFTGSRCMNLPSRVHVVLNAMHPTACVVRVG